MNPELVVKAALDIGEAMLKSGAETVRVEDTISRICRSYYEGRLDVTSYLSTLFVSMEVTDWTEQTESPRIITQHRRISSVSNNLNKLEELNALSRYVCENTPTPEEIEMRLQSILKTVPTLKRYLIGYCMVGFGFTVFFGGNLMDGLCCSIISIMMYLADRHTQAHINNELIRTFILSFITGLAACLLQLSALPIHMDKIMIGNVMLLIPGLAFTNSLRDLFTGDIVSGSLKLLNSLMLAVAVALGFAVSMIMTGV